MAKLTAWKPSSVLLWLVDSRVERVFRTPGWVIDSRVLTIVLHSRICVTTNFPWAGWMVDVGVMRKGRGVGGMFGTDINSFQCSSRVRLVGLLLIDKILPEQNEKYKMNSLHTITTISTNNANNRGS